MKLLFLDIDGVLVTARTLAARRGRARIADDRCVKALNHLTTATGAKIVLSSSWRFCGLCEMQILLAYWGVCGDVIDFTDDMTSQTPSGLYLGTPRGNEIQRYLSQASDVEAFVIVDDANDMGTLSSHLLLTQFEEGLTEEIAEAAIGMLGLDDHPCPADSQPLLRLLTRLGVTASVPFDSNL